MSYTEPLLTVLLLGLMVGIWRDRQRRSQWALVAGLGLFLLSWPPMEWAAGRHLEAWYPVRPFTAPPAGAIVVLSGSVAPKQWERPFALASQDTLERCEFAAWLFHEWKNVPVLVSGGPGQPGQPPFAATMKTMLERSGIPPAMIWTETRSRSTHENAVHSSGILRSHGIGQIALVVEARSMLRAEACFRKQGIEVTPAPSSFRYLSGWREELLPSWRAIRRNEITLHETAGLAWYWWRGWI